MRLGVGVTSSRVLKDAPDGEGMSGYVSRFAIGGHRFLSLEGWMSVRLVEPQCCNPVEKKAPGKGGRYSASSWIVRHPKSSGDATSTSFRMNSTRRCKPDLRGWLRDESIRSRSGTSKIRAFSRLWEDPCDSVGSHVRRTGRDAQITRKKRKERQTGGESTWREDSALGLVYRTLQYMAMFRRTKTRHEEKGRNNQLKGT